MIDGREATLHAIADEMREPLDIVEAVFRFERQEYWPLRDVLPVKRCTRIPTSEDGAVIVEEGMMRLAEGPVVITYGTPVGYPSFLAVAEDGWRPD
jgi:hypothetical protein